MIALLLAMATAEPRPPAPQAAAAHPDALAFFADRDAAADIDRAFADAKISGKNVLIVMGANWCHDSRALAGWLDTPRFLPMMLGRFHVVYVDAGMPQAGRGRNSDIAARFGFKKLKGTPLVVVAAPDGQMLNSRKDALSWRNAASRSEDEIFDYFNGANAIRK